MYLLLAKLNRIIKKNTEGKLNRAHAGQEMRRKKTYCCSINLSCHQEAAPMLSLPASEE